MAKKKNTVAKIVAGFALFGIIVGILGTAILVIFSGGTNNTQPQLSEAELQELIKKLESSASGTTASGTLTITGSTDK